jgi:hypothetical protein
MKIVISTGFPYDYNDNYIHAEEQEGVMFVSKELLDSIIKYIQAKEQAKLNEGYKEIQMWQKLLERINKL